MARNQINLFARLVAIVRTGSLDDIGEAIAGLGADRVELLNVARPHDPEHVPPLFAAVQRGDVAIVEALLDAGAKMDLRGPNQRPILMQAYMSRHIDVAAVLTARGADLLATNALGTRVFDTAISAGHLPTIEHFLATGVALDHVNLKGSHVLHRACESGKVDVLELVMAHGKRQLDDANNEGMRPIDEARTLPLYEACLARAPDLPIDVCFANGDHPIHRFARRGLGEIVMFQLDRGVPIDLLGHERNTILHYAVASRKVELVCDLVARGAKLEARNKCATRPLHWAVQTGSIELVRTLVEAGAKLNPKTSVSFIIQETQTPLYQAVATGYMEIVRYLLARGANPNVACDSSHGTALTMACDRDDVAAVDLLLAHGASANGLQSDDTPDYFYFPLGKARSAEVVDRLVAAGADVHAKHRYGDTALHMLVEHAPSDLGPDGAKRLLAAAEALLRHGADPNVRDMHGRTPSMRTSSADMSRVIAGGASRKPPDLGRLLLNVARDLGSDGKLELLLSLLQHADADDVNCTRDLFHSEGETVMMRVVRAMPVAYRNAPLTQYIDAFEQLLARGARVDRVETLFGENVLHKLARVTHAPVPASEAALLELVAQRLVDAGTPLDLANDDGCHALDLVVLPSLFRILQSNGARLGATHMALFHVMEAFAKGGESIDTVDTFLDMGVPLECRSPLDDTPWLFAARLDSAALLNHLKARGSDRDARGAEQGTALHIACSYEALNAAGWLIEHGTSMETLDAQGRTPLDLVRTKTQRAKLARLAKCRLA